MFGNRDEPDVDSRIEELAPYERDYAAAIAREDRAWLAWHAARSAEISAFQEWSDATAAVGDSFARFSEAVDRLVIGLDL
jgi:hypothetical protein